MPPLRVGRLLLACALAALAGAERRGRTTPGLSLDTGGRTGTCDALTFTPDGQWLLAAGDDKVVRQWRVTDTKLTPAPERTLRWPVFRERRGAIYALALSPDAKGVVVGGFGVKNGLLAVLDRATGAVRHLHDPTQNAAVVWSAAYAPGGTAVAFGDDAGDRWLWDLEAGDARKLAGEAGRRAGPNNRVRLVAFDGGRLLSVARDGRLLRHDPADPGRPPELVAAFAAADVFRAAIDPGRRRVAVTNRTGGAVEVRSLADPGTAVEVPMPAGYRAQSLAFSADGRRLAVGAVVVSNRSGVPQEAGGRVLVFDLAETGGSRPPLAVFDVGYTPDAVAFDPTSAGTRLATAGGDDHEVRLWDVAAPARPLDTAVGVGSCLWGVAFAADGKSFGFQGRRAADPDSVNRRGAGPWRVFDLTARELLPPGRAAGFRPADAAESAGGWSLRTTSATAWTVVGPGGAAFPLDRTLYDEAVNGLPRCYGFLPDPPRLVIGHTWGASLYALTDAGPRLARVMAGHDGEVMALSVSPDRSLLLTAGRDQTVACFTLAGWEGGELGATFRPAGDGSLEVVTVAPGGPAWEVGLLPEDRVTAAVAIARRTHFHAGPDWRATAKQFYPAAAFAPTDDAAGMMKKLAEARPGQEVVFVWSRAGGPPAAGLTTVRQRPLWKFFPTRAEAGGEWLLWRWRDYYYDTNAASADRLAGWHVNPADLLARPPFYPLGQFAGRFYKPAKLADLLARPVPDRVAVPDIEPPVVRVSPAPGAGVDLVKQDLELTLTAEPRDDTPEQRVELVKLWVNDHVLDLKDLARPAGGAVRGVRLTVPRDQLVPGRNSVVLQAYNGAAVRGEATLAVTLADDGRPKARLFGLAVGVNDYDNARTEANAIPQSLESAVADARGVAALVRGQGAAGLYGRVECDEVLEADATAAGILERLARLKGKVRADDWLVVFLAGHGEAEREKAAPGRPRAYKPGTFYYVCSDTEARVPSTRLGAGALHEALAALPCRKLLLLDACHSGAAGPNAQSRDVNPDGRLLVVAACKADQVAYEHPSKGHGLFTLALIEALGGDARADRDGDGLLDAGEIAAYAAVRIPEYLTELGKEPGAQSPDHRRPVDSAPLARPRAAK